MPRAAVGDPGGLDAEPGAPTDSDASPAGVAGLARPCSLVRAATTDGAARWSAPARVPEPQPALGRAAAASGSARPRAHGPRSRPRPEPDSALYLRAHLGLGNLPPEWSSAQDPRATANRQLTQALTLSAAVFTVTALFHLFRYILLSVNRTYVIPSWADRATVWLVLFSGVCAAFAVAVAVVALARWIIQVRADAYRQVGRLEPRPWWQVWPAVVVPVVNLIGPTWLLYEVADLGIDDELLNRRKQRMMRVWVAWLGVNLLAAVAIIYQFTADSIQHRADGLFFVIVSAAVSAVFSWWYRVRLPRVFDAPAPVAVQTTRWVVAQ